jgi:hypothetical protein
MNELQSKYYYQWTNLKRKKQMEILEHLNQMQPTAQQPSLIGCISTIIWKFSWINIDRNDGSG